MGLFRRKKNARTDGGAVVSDRDATKADMQQLREFTASRKGVEAFVEPKTSVTQTTMLLVAADGEWTRRRVDSPEAAAALAKKLEIPCYDANRVGYPQRMRDYNVRSSQNKRTQTATKPVKTTQSPKELAALMTLESIAGVPPLADNPSKDDLERLWKRARAAAHPDRLNGDRSQWDKVEESARALGVFEE
jgi:hypothetical protein